MGKVITKTGSSDKKEEPRPSVPIHLELSMRMGSRGTGRWGSRGINISESQYEGSNDGHFGDSAMV